MVPLTGVHSVYAVDSVIGVNIGNTVNNRKETTRQNQSEFHQKTRRGSIESVEKLRN
jgi:hypothetical protein